MNVRTLLDLNSIFRFDTYEVVVHWKLDFRTSRVIFDNRVVDHDRNISEVVLDYSMVAMTFSAVTELFNKMKNVAVIVESSASFSDEALIEPSVLCSDSSWVVVQQTKRNHNVLTSLVLQMSTCR